MYPAFKRRAFLVCLVLVTGLSALSVRLISLQVWERRYSKKSIPPRLELKERIPATWGNIVDRHDERIVMDRMEAALTADLNHLKFPDILVPALAGREALREDGWDELNEEEKSKRLAEIGRGIRREWTKAEIVDKHQAYAASVIGPEIDMPGEDLIQMINATSSKRVVVKKRLPENVADRVEEILAERLIQGFRFERSRRRHYTMPALAPHTIGIQVLKKDGWVGVSGLERAELESLRGRDGERTLKRDENGLVHLTKPAQVIQPIMGKDIKVTLDMEIQAIVEQELEMAFEDFKAKHGSIIVIDPHTGDILAMASRPHFDLKLREDYENSRLNFAVAAQFEAGSVMKIVPMAAALESGRVSRDTVVDCGWGGIKRDGFFLKDHHPYGELSFDMVIAKSSNTGVFQFAETIGRERFYNALTDFGFGSRTGLGLDEEIRGRVWRSTNNRDFASITYGYGVSVTPLQLAMAYSVVANGGLLMKPRLVDTITTASGVLIEKKPVQQVRRVIRNETASQMRLALEQVVLKGTGTRAEVEGYRTAGKTGTSFKWDNDKKCYDEQKRFVTFAGMLPVENPRFVCVVTFDEPSGFPEDFSVGGGTLAAPVFSVVAGRVARSLNLAPTE